MHYKWKNSFIGILLRNKENLTAITSIIGQNDSHFKFFLNYTIHFARINSKMEQNEHVIRFFYTSHFDEKQPNTSYLDV
jgi:hypothetical protein